LRVDDYIRKPYLRRFFNPFLIPKGFFPKILVDLVCTVRFTTATLPMCSHRIGNVRISTSVPAPAARAEADCCSLSYGRVRADATVVPIRVRPRPWFCLVPLRRPRRAGLRRAGLLRPRRFQLDFESRLSRCGHAESWRASAWLSRPAAGRALQIAVPGGRGESRFNLASLTVKLEWFQTLSAAPSSSLPQPAPGRRWKSNVYWRYARAKSRLRLKLKPRPALTCREPRIYWPAPGPVLP
jgi:hypothetical protein